MGLTQFGPQRSYALQAAADLTAYQYRAVRYVATEQTNLASLGTASTVLGVLQNKPKANEAATIGYDGLSKAFAGAAITAGDVLTFDGTGYLITVVSGNMAVGRALTAAAVAGDEITAVLFPPVRWAGAP